METKQKFDKDRMEMYPPILQEPYTLVQKDGLWLLMNGSTVIDKFKSDTEHGAIRMANIFIKNLDF